MKMITNIEFTKEEREHFNCVLNMFKKLQNTAIDDIISDEVCEEKFCSIIVDILEQFETAISGEIRRNIE